MSQKTRVFSNAVVGASDFKIEALVLKYVELLVMNELVEYTDGGRRSLERCVSVCCFVHMVSVGIEPGPPRYRGCRPTAEHLNNISGAPYHPTDYRRA